MKTFQEIINKTNWQDVRASIEKLYPDDVDDMNRFEDVYNILKTLQPSVNKDKVYIIIEFIDEKLIDTDNKTEANIVKNWNVSGKIMDDETHYAIEFCRWENWLGYYISKELLLSMDSVDIVAHCLWEMTWCGFTQREIQDKVNYLENLADEAMEEYKNNPEGFMILDELLKDEEV